METDPHTYLRALSELYFRLPETPRHLSRYDRRLAFEWFQQRIPLTVVEGAFLLASVRRTCRPAQARPLGPVRSLAYFQPVIEEILHNPLPASYIPYLRSKLPLRTGPQRSRLSYNAAISGLAAMYEEETGNDACLNALPSRTLHRRKCSCGVADKEFRNRRPVEGHDGGVTGCYASR